MSRALRRWACRVLAGARDVGRARAVSVCVLGVLLAVPASAAVPATAEPFTLGVYYFPGWKDGQDKVGAAYAKPWDKIKPYPEREPLLGWYAEGEQSVMDGQIGWMRRYGLDYVVFSQLFWEDGRPQLDHASRAFMASKTKGDFKFAVQWANHASLPHNDQEFDAIIGYCIQNYFKRPDYMYVDGAPVLFMFSSSLLREKAAKFGGSVPKMLARAQEMAHAAGLPGITFVAGGETDPSGVAQTEREGYRAISAYNYHNGPSGSGSRGYADLAAGYRWNWDKIAGAKPAATLIVPVTAGWDKRPWGGSGDPLHDHSIATPNEFRAHLAQAKTFIRSHWRLTQGNAVICCWNEFGEGSFVEPTKRYGSSMLQQVQAVFRPAAATGQRKNR